MALQRQALIGPKSVVVPPRKNTASRRPSGLLAEARYRKMSPKEILVGLFCVCDQWLLRIVFSKQN